MIWHSDQGSQFVPLAFHQQARAAGIASSMGSRGERFDNPIAEGFFAHLEEGAHSRPLLAVEGRAARGRFGQHQPRRRLRVSPMSVVVLGGRDLTARGTGP
jgi:transposase InsO family protein